MQRSYFCGTPTATLGLENLGLWLRLRAQNQTPTPGRNVWHTDCVLKDDLRENIKYFNKKCTIVYMKNFNRKLNWANVCNNKTSTISYFCPNELEHTWSRKSPSKGRFQLRTKTPTLTAHPCHTVEWNINIMMQTGALVTSHICCVWIMLWYVTVFLHMTV